MLRIAAKRKALAIEKFNLDTSAGLVPTDDPLVGGLGEVGDQPRKAAGQAAGRLILQD